MVRFSLIFLIGGVNFLCGCATERKTTAAPAVKTEQSDAVAEMVRTCYKLPRAEISASPCRYLM